MLTKAIIDSKVNNYSYKVRIPIINKLSSASNPTRNENLSEAAVCVWPGEEVIFEPGEIVFVDFENDDLSSPIILGTLFRAAPKNSFTNLKAATLKVDLAAELPKYTQFGNIKAEAFNAVLNSADALQSTMDVVAEMSEDITATAQEVQEAKNIFN